MKKPFKVAVLISGRGSNLKNLIDKAHNFEINAVLCNDPAAPGLKYAAEAGIYTRSFRRDDYSSLKEVKRAMREKLGEIAPDLIALAGFMLVLDPPFVQAFDGRIINIHPSLLPDFPGLDTHHRVIASGATRHGCTVHVVDSGIDTGRVIAQAELRVASGETEEQLARRVLALEHQIYPWVIDSIAGGDITITPARISFSADAVSGAKAKGFSLANTR